MSYDTQKKLKQKTNIAQIDDAGRHVDMEFNNRKYKNLLTFLSQNILCFFVCSKQCIPFLLSSFSAKYLGICNKTNDQTKHLKK